MNDAAGELTPEAARNRLVARLTGPGRITHPGVIAALRAVPRHLFVPPGTSIGAAYADDVVVTRRDAAGTATSSVSAPWLQAAMLEAAGLRPGARVLEIGSGGYNAALIAELAGPSGEVTSIDIDPDVIAAARTALDRAGYPHVRVAVADAEHGFAERAPYDAVIVTVEAADVPPAWSGQLAPDGVLVVPLRMRAHTRCVTLRRHDDHLVAGAALECGFVAMQGEGRDPMRRVKLRGDDAVLQLDDACTGVEAGPLAAALDGPRAELWSPVTARTDEPAAFEQLHLWLASQPRPYATFRVDRERTAGLLDPQDKFLCPTLLGAGSLAYLTMRAAGDGVWQFGAHGFGPEGARLAGELAGLVAVWDRVHRGGGGPRITVHPGGAVPPGTGGLRLLVPRRHTTTVISWGGAAPVS